MPVRFPYYRYDIKEVEIEGDLSEGLRILGFDYRDVINIETLDKETSYYRVFLRHKYIYK